MICIIGPTASGKTALAVAVAHWLGGEIISADSRQVYRGMDLGTGKDLSEYSGSRGEGMAVPYHLIDILPAGEKYDVFRYQQDFDAAYSDIIARGKMPVLCGGSGLYIEAATGTTNYVPVPVNEELRTGLAERSLDELSEILTDLLGSEALHNHTDTDTREHALRAIEIATYKKQNPVAKRVPPPYQLFTLHFEPSILRSRIKERLLSRLNSGMIEEVEGLLASGISAEQLSYYGLEYRYITEYLQGLYTREEMIERLGFAINQFAKRQRTWFRRMERQGYLIHAIDGNLPLSEQLRAVQTNLYCADVLML